ncbi:MAG: class I SAM-dependent methyltransferase [bacterium]
MLGKKLETNANFWRRWWNLQSNRISSDHDLDRISSIHDKEMEKFFEKEFLDFVDPTANDCVFDAGCGTGINLSKLSSRVEAVIGMDQSEGMITRCKKRIAKEKVFNVKLIIGDISLIGLKSNTFDKIICMSVLQYLNDEECEAALKELVRISKDGAIIVFHVKNLFSLYLSTLYLAKKIKSLFTKNLKPGNYRSYRWYEQRLSKLGAQTVDSSSSNIFLIDFLPKFLIYPLQRIERKYYKSNFFRKYGADYKIKAKVKKTNGITC